MATPPAAPLVTLFGHSGFKATDHALVGMPPPDPALPFAALFARHYQPRLGKRADGFQTLFAALGAMPAPPLILETGSLRLADNWEGDGQSTYLFDVFIQAERAHQRGGALFSIDLSLDSVAVARRVCSGVANLICNDSVQALHTLAGLLPGRRASLLYLDSFDLDLADPMPSATHHLMELAAAAPLLGTGSLVAIDDYCLDGKPGGKGLLVDLYMDSIGAAVIHSGYQRIWRMP